ETHLSESIGEVENAKAQYGRSPVQIMADSGFLDGGAILAHCVHLSDEDAELIRSSGSTIVTDPASNAKLGNGIAPVAKYLDMGINLCIGTDGVSSNNTLNMFREMALLSLMQKGANSDCTVLSADQVIAMATVNAAKALGMEGRLGTISEGAEADLIFLDLNASSLFPNNNVVSSLCYSANGSEVVSVMAGGKLLMKNRELLTIDRERVYSEVRRIQKKYFS
ncbi:MAG TPA: amidohydrolase family protein, partial [Ruminococcus sp.]|nr:amidohydrolase family protein [Ruminococcus sp.]